MSQQERLIQQLLTFPEAWSLTPVRGKAPFRVGWQSEPALSRDELANLIRNDHTITGIGLRCGSWSQNVLAIDPDNYEAFEWYRNTFGIELEGLACTSGLPGKAKYLFEVDWEFAEYICNKSINCKETGAKIDFLWEGKQAVLPPSIHPETKSEYIWVEEDSNGYSIPKLPYEVANWFKQLAEQKTATKQERKARNNTNNVIHAPFVEGENPWNILSFIHCEPTWNPEGRKDWGTSDCPFHAGDGNTEHIHINISSGAIHAHCGCDTTEIYQHFKRLAESNGHKFPNRKEWNKKQERAERGQNLLNSLGDRSELFKQMYWLDPRHAKIVNQEKLNADLIADWKEGLLGIQSFKGSGKTHLCHSLIEECKRTGEPFILFSSHNTLLRSSAEDIGIPFHHDVSDNGGLNRVQFVAITLESNYKLDPNHWRNATIVIDEGEQFLRTLTSSGTLNDNRIKIIRHFIRLLRGARRVALFDANLRQNTVDYFESVLEEKPSQTIINEAQAQPWDIHWIQCNNFTGAYQLIREMVADGKKLAIACESQKRVVKLERHLRELFPNKRITAIHGDVTDTEEIQDYVRHINTSVINDDILIYSSSLSTGTSIDVPHFDGVVGLYDGLVIPAEQAGQMLARVRDNTIPRYVYQAAHCNSTLPTNPATLKKNLMVTARKNDKLAGKECEYIADELYDAWAEKKAEVYQSLTNPYDRLFTHLYAEGHNLIPVNIKADAALAQRFALLKEQLDREHCEAVFNAKPITEAELADIECKTTTTPEERCQRDKFKIARFYPEDFTPELIQDDNRGELRGQIWQYYNLYADINDVIESDMSDHKFKKGYAPDLPFNTYRRKAREELGLENLLDPNSPWTNENPKVLEIHARLTNPNDHIREVLNYRPSAKAYPIAVVKTLLKQLGLKLAPPIKRRINGKIVRFYHVLTASLERAKACAARIQERKDAAKLAQEVNGAAPSEVWHKGQSIVNSSGVVPHPVDTVDNASDAQPESITDDASPQPELPLTAFVPGQKVRVRSNHPFKEMVGRAGFVKQIDVTIGMLVVEMRNALDNLQNFFLFPMDVEVIA